jgi:hypothetical protein
MKKQPSVLEIQRPEYSVSEAMIGSAHFEISNACDSMMVYQVPKMVDSILKDPVLLLTFYDTIKCKVMQIKKPAN